MTSLWNMLATLPAAFLSGLLAVFAGFAYKERRSKQKQSDTYKQALLTDSTQRENMSWSRMQNILEYLQREVDDLRHELEDRVKRHEECERRCKELEARVAALESKSVQKGTI